MHQYIVDTEFAARGLIDLLSGDSQSLTDLLEQQKQALAKESAYNLAFLQNEMRDTANYWHGRLYEASKDRLELDKQIAFFEAQIMDKRHSLSALAGALLQISKQGISSVHGRPANCPDGRDVQTVKLKELIWAGRNQAQHFEEIRKIDDTTAEVFARLNTATGFTQLPDPRSQVNLAHDVVITLGWLDYAQYEQDIVSLLG